MAIRRRLAKFFFWTLLLCFSTLAGGLWFTYTHFTNSENLTRLVRQYAKKYLPKASVDTRVDISLLRGEITLTKVAIRQKIDDTPITTLAVPWLRVRVDPRKMFNGEADIREIDVVQPTLRLIQRHDGTWNIQGLLADPWPGPWLEKTPPIIIREGKLELITEDDPHTGPTTAGLSSMPPFNARQARPLAPGPAAPAALNPRDRDVATNPNAAVILRDLSLRLDSLGGLKFNFDGSANGDVFDRLKIKGMIDFATGDLTLIESDLAGLTLSEALRRRLPPEARPAFNALSLNSGVVDLQLSRLAYRPKANAADRLRYAGSAQLREGVCECPKLPFPLSNVTAQLDAADGLITIRHAQGWNGTTFSRVDGTFRVGSPATTPFDLHVGLGDLELDPRLRNRTPADLDDLWDLFKPRGRIDVNLDLTRLESGRPVEVRARVHCRDVSGTYRYFPYELDHLTGDFTLEHNRLTLDMRTLGSTGLSAHLKGEIDNPGKDAIVKLDVEADAVPINQKLFTALPKDVRKVVDQFRPKGTVKLAGKVSRVPMEGKPEGDIKIHANLDLLQQCEIQWAEFPYPVRDLTGRLELHPDFWKFNEMRGRNGYARIQTSGWVRKLDNLKKRPNGDEPLKVHVNIKAYDLPFTEELRAALPQAWAKVWKTINPSGASDFDATIDVEADKPDNIHAEIIPKPESNAKLQIQRVAVPDIDSGGLLELPVEDVLGRFVYHNGTVTMSDVSLHFRGAPVQFALGTVRVEDTGSFDLRVKELRIKEIRIDSNLRKKMPPRMEHMARKLDDGNTYTAHGDLRIGWSGVSGEPAWCRWDNTVVVFNNNRVETGIPLEHIHGQLSNVSGWSNGTALQVDGAINLGSITVLGQQITRVESPFHVRAGNAELADLRASFLGGEITGNGSISLDNTPRYNAMLVLRGAQLQEYAKFVNGHQSYRGRVDGEIEISGLGNDVHTLQGGGNVQISEGDLVELPVYLRLAQILKLPRALLRPSRERGGKPLFDSAKVDFKIAHGRSTLDPIKFTGNAFSLEGDGTLDPQGTLDVRLKVLLGIDIPIISEISRDLTSQILMVRVKGSPSAPDYSVEPLPNLLRVPFRSQSDQ